MQGLIFIPDITGFTNFVNNVDNELGVFVTKNLLNEIISSNPLNIKLSDIEGDAILYYKTGEPIALAEMFDAFKKITKAFDKKFSQLKGQFKFDAHLSLKFIVHYGDIDVFDIGGFRQLYGEAVIESHRLLKNGCGGSNYILITQDYFAALEQCTSEVSLNDEDFTYHCSDFYTGLRNVGYYFFNYYPAGKKKLSLVRA